MSDITSDSILDVRQILLRMEASLADELKVVARRQGKSVNAYATEVLARAVEEATPKTGVEEMREKLRAAGVLAEIPLPPDFVPPTDEEFEAARRLLGAAPGPTLTELVIQEREAAPW
jgi:plasmid stability protein